MRALWNGRGCNVPGMQGTASGFVQVRFEVDEVMVEGQEAQGQDFFTLKAIAADLDAIGCPFTTPRALTITTETST